MRIEGWRRFTVGRGAPDNGGVLDIAPDGKPMLQPRCRRACRAWLADNHATSGGLGGDAYKKSSGRQTITYDDLVEEVLCFGWIDSKPNKLDYDRSLLWLEPRMPKSAWSRPKKERVDRRLAEGLMSDAGLRMVERAKESGTWDMLNQVEDLVVPSDLAAAFDRHPGAAQQWESFSHSSRRGSWNGSWVRRSRRPGPTGWRSPPGSPSPARRRISGSR